MRINIKGDGVTPELIAEALRKCEKDHGLKIKGATIYLKFEDHLGRTVEPLQDDREITRDFTFRKLKPVPASPVTQRHQEPVDPISAQDMIDLCQRAAHRCLSSPEMRLLVELAKQKVERGAFHRTLNEVVAATGRLDRYAIEDLVRRCTK